jgi:membrane protease YdiL (CAAX protease family)
MSASPLGHEKARDQREVLPGSPSGGATETRSKSASAKAVLREVFLVFLGVTGATLAINRLQSLPALSEYANLLTSLVFLVTAVGAAQRDTRGIKHYGLDLSGLLLPPNEPPVGIRGSIKDVAAALARATPSGLRELAVAVATAALVLPAFTLGFYLWYAPGRSFANHLTTDLLWSFISQLLVVGLPEEALFRGYFQTRIADCTPARIRIFGVAISPLALALQAVLFALIHFAVDLQVARLAVFFPALLFGWLRAWRGGIGAAIAFHAICNLYSDILARGWQLG